MPVNLFTPIVNTRTPAVNFFNGRLLSGEDLTTEHKSNRAARALLGQAIGSGVVNGFEVSESAASSTTQAPVLAVTKGLAINANGASLLLDGDVEIALTRPPTSTSTTATVFQTCSPIQTGAYVAGAGAYLLTVGPAALSEGLAQVNGISTSGSPCNTDYKAHGVQFRLVQIELSQADIADPAHLQNTLAYRCFGVADFAPATTNPLLAGLAPTGIVEQLRAANLVTACEVSLAILYWTATSGLVFIDMWAVRRSVLPGELVRSQGPEASRRQIVLNQAMLQQFNAQINALSTSSGFSISQASQAFRYLPPAGILPITGLGASTGVDYRTFFGGLALRKPQFIEGAAIADLARHALAYPPIDLNDKVMIWIYWIRENIQAINTGSGNPPNACILFATGQIPNYGHPHFDVNLWDYSTYA